MNNLKKIGIGSIFTICPIYLYNKSNNKNKSYTYKEIEQHKTKDNGIWITYKNSVYDITNFVDNHPGGKDKIMLAAGKGVEPYWNLYKQHLNNNYINNEILEPMKIGEIKDYNPDKYLNLIDLYNNEPDRSNNLTFHSVTPCNAEVINENLNDEWITPNDEWYVRNHGPVPNIDLKNYKLTIENLNKNPIVLDFNNIKKYKKKEVISTMQCGGNRRGEYNNIEKTSGTPWKIGAISTAKWSGISLLDFLTKNGLNKEIIDKYKYTHIIFEGYDGVTISIDINKILNESNDIILAYEMNDKIIPRDHGYPLRLIIPGHVGIRNIKWLKSIKFSIKEVDSAWQTGLNYKVLPPYIKNINDISLDNFHAMNEMPVQSCITDIEKNEDELIIKGFAWSGGGKGIIRVDISVDNGETWHLSELKDGSNQDKNKSWAWTFWEYKYIIPKKFRKKDMNIICKAVDNSYNTQPENIENIWNIRGLNNNSWHKVNYKL